MTPPPPLPAPAPARLRPSERALAALLALGALSVLVVAASLKPSATGITTHAALGLPPCGFEATTGYPCMTCGMTTSFAWAVRCNLVASLWVQPMGTILALLCAVVFWGGLYAAATGSCIHRVVSGVPLRTWTWVFFAMTAAAWLWKVYIHRTGQDGWP